MPIGYDMPSSGGTTINNLNDINDVNVPSPSNEDIIYFDSSLGKWISGPISGLIGGSIPTSLSDLADVAPDASLAAGQLLWYNGSVWTNTGGLTTDGDLAISSGYKYNPVASNPLGTDHGTWVNSTDDKLYYDDVPLRREETNTYFLVSTPSPGDIISTPTSYTLPGTPTAPDKVRVSINGIELDRSLGQFTVSSNQVTVYPTVMGYGLSDGDQIIVSWY